MTKDNLSNKLFIDFYDVREIRLKLYYFVRNRNQAVVCHVQDDLNLLKDTLCCRSICERTRLLELTYLENKNKQICKRDDIIL